MSERGNKPTGEQPTNDIPERVEGPDGEITTKEFLKRYSTIVDEIPTVGTDFIYGKYNFGVVEKATYPNSEGVDKNKRHKIWTSKGYYFGDVQIDDWNAAPDSKLTPKKDTPIAAPSLDSMPDPTDKITAIASKLIPKKDTPITAPSLDSMPDTNRIAEILAKLQPKKDKPFPAPSLDSMPDPFDKKK